MSSPYWKCNYDEMITFYPRYYRENLEMNAILRAEGGLADNVQACIDKMLMNNFIDGMDAKTLTELEAFLQLSMLRERTVEERRRFIKCFIAGMGKVSATRISETIRAYTDTEAVCDLYPYDSDGNNRLDIMFERGNAPVVYISDIYTLLAKMLPAHIEYRAILTYYFSAGVGYSRQHYKYYYDACGTKPYSVLIGDYENRKSVIRKKIRAALMNYKYSDATSEISGIYPTSALIAQIMEAPAAAFSDIKQALTDYYLSDDSTEFSGLLPLSTLIASIFNANAAVSAEIERVIKEYELSGKTPQTALIAQIEDVLTAAGIDISNVVMDFKSSGVEPDVATLANNGVISAASVKISTDCDVDYIPCGTIFSGNGG